MNGIVSARRDLRERLAMRGLRTWALDYRTHAVPADATAEELSAMDGWTADVFTDDAAWAADFVRRADRGPLVVAGFSYGASIAYRLAARNEALAGLVILDGAPPDGTPLRERSGPAIDVGSNRLPFEERRQLLAAVARDPAGSSPVAGYPSAGAALADIVYTSRSFGGRGGLSAARDGVTDVSDLAALLTTYDRWWPSAALGGPAVAPSHRVRVLAFAAENMGPQWVDRVRTGARTWGGEQAIVHELPGHGHVDVLIGRDTDRLVVEPIVVFALAADGPD
jgi:pimeloyl-ACP methyl ester carboxylesterase